MVYQVCQDREQVPEEICIAKWKESIAWRSNDFTRTETLRPAKLWQSHEDIQKLIKDWSSESRDRVPSFNSTEALGVTARIASRSNLFVMSVRKFNQSQR